MTLNDYQKQAMKTCMESSNNFSYMMLNLVGEVGEFASKVAKAIRKEEAEVEYPGNVTFYGESLPEDHPAYVRLIAAENGDDMVEYDAASDEFNAACDEQAKAFTTELQKEAGDILWQLSGLCSVMGWSLEDIAQQNLDKLKSRKERDVIDGNGDNR